ncbi:MAG: hypothetical protein RSD47_04365, partial [Romboutsia sp.]
MKYLYKEENINKKIDKFIDIYNQIVKENNNKSNNIMIIVPNNSTRNKYQEKINLSFSEEIKVTTYLGFIKKELIKFWSLVDRKCDKIHKKVISPIFISNSLSDYIINTQVESKRSLDGYF